MENQTEAKPKRRWACLVLALVAIAALVFVALNLGNINSDGQAAPNDQPAVQQPGEQTGATEEMPDLTQFELRAADDLLAAGPVDAPVGIVVFSDYQCKFCAKWSTETLPQVLDYAKDGKVRIEWRDVNIFGEDSERASLASYAAAKQGKFWEYHDELFAGSAIRKGAELSEKSLTELAAELGLDTEQFAKDLKSEQAATVIEGNAQLGLQLGVYSTPAFLIDGEPVMGAQPKDVFIDKIESALAAQDAN